MKTRPEAKYRSCCRKVSVLWYPGGQTRRFSDPSCPEIQSTVISLITFKCNWSVIYVCPYSGRTHESLNILLLLFVAAKQNYKMKFPFFFFKHTLVLEAQGNTNQQAVEDCYHYLSEIETAVAGEMCSVSLRCLMLCSMLSLGTPEEAKYFLFKCRQHALEDSVWKLSKLLFL